MAPPATCPSGVWVRSVASGSPADNAGILPGDIIYMLENEVLALDGTMTDYCDVLRSRDSGDTMSVTIIRWSDLSLWEGQLNGREIELTGYFSGDGGDGGNGGDTGGGTLPVNCIESDNVGYMSCLDDTNTIILDVPLDWADVNGGVWTWDGTEIGVAVSAAPNNSDFFSYFDAPGVFFGASATFAEIGGYVQFLDYYNDDYESGCSYDGRYDYNDGIYRGKFDSYFNCGGRLRHLRVVGRAD
jgi:serine protease Do